MTTVLSIAIALLILIGGLLDDYRRRWKALYQDMVSKMAVGTQQLTEARQRLTSCGQQWEADRQKLFKAVIVIGQLDTTLRKLFPEDHRQIDAITPCEYASSVLIRQKQLLDKREAIDKELNKFCDLKTLEMLVRRAETMPQINMPKGVKVFTDEIGQVLFSPNTVGKPPRYFVYLHRSASVALHRVGREFHTTERPDFRGVPFAKITFVQDEWLTHGEVIGKLAAAAKSLAVEVKA